MEPSSQYYCDNNDLIEVETGKYITVKWSAGPWSINFFSHGDLTCCYESAGTTCDNPETRDKRCPNLPDLLEAHKDRFASLKSFKFEKEHQGYYSAFKEGGKVPIGSCYLKSLAKGFDQNMLIFYGFLLFLFGTGFDMAIILCGLYCLKKRDSRDQAIHDHTRVQQILTGIVFYFLPRRAEIGNKYQILPRAQQILGLSAL